MDGLRRIIKINKGVWRADFSWLGALEKIIVGRFKIKKNISLALVSPTTIRNLNRIYRSKDRVTDVLSFNIDSAFILGEVIICLAEAKRRARQKAVSLESELKLLTVHGILHLLGYDHEQSLAAERRQSRQESKILSILK